MFRFRRNLPIGEWRFIENFKVSASGGKYRPTPLPYKITFTSDTVIGRSVFEDDDPCLDLVSYQDIDRQGSDANVLIGMIVTLCFIVYINLINQCFCNLRNWVI